MENQEIREELLRGRMLDVEIGTRLQIQVGGADNTLKVNCVLVGIAPEEFLILTIPAVPGVLSKLYEGSRVRVRYIFGGGVYGFDSSVITCIHKPKLIAFITYPRSIESINLRKAKRLISLLPVYAEIDNRPFAGMLLDLSKGGCRLSMESGEQNLPIIGPGDRLRITLQLGGAARVLAVRGTVQTVRHEGKFAEMGIKFVEDDAASMTEIENYLNSLLRLRKHVPSI